MPNASPTAILFELSGCLVDFGARTLPIALQRLHPQCTRTDTLGSPQQVLAGWLGQAPTPTQLQALQQMLSEVADEHAELTPGAEQLLHRLHADAIPCAWLDSLPADASLRLAEALPVPVTAALARQARPWPAPDACWQALSQLGVERLDGCVLVSGNPRLLQAGLNAGCWTIGLAACGPLCGLAPADWQALTTNEQERLRAEATLQLYRLGTHSVVDHLGEIQASLEDIGMRRLKGEKP
ncbi:HAD family phosphatase [Ectopseudomonas hydrolytica]|jgi:beta-phosphoglucomutase-like phosphatase (HAD superfamily)|uniref:HAD family phosphatase n=1 Tax=Ectopseudomonas hydrolytica TaxID=2493633 RepID=UPI0018A71077|nr:HAD family phosphatase [Pseudomonas hydrolytica]MBF8160986.1 HAD family phosphatase [Pseudomonas mendocina]UTH29728.1 HAD family phosphatase [Pseudomonas hydrolytica]UZZ08763.1 HAD family phosphatase [Pseudomonas mendocina]